MTGRGTSAQWHTETRTAKSAILRKLAPSELLIEMHEADAARLSIADGSRVQISSRRASLTCGVRISLCVKPGEVFLPMHDSRVNQLTFWSVDPHSRQPSYKHCAVSIELA
jgi:assimilatory nitrate reductase catalytic subunit